MKFFYASKQFVIIILLMLASGIFHDARATHAAGADLTYTCLGGLQYQIEATFYRDCGGSAEPNSVIIRYESPNCGVSKSVVAYKVPGANGTEITMPCVAMPTSCNGGTSTGLQKWVYRAVVTLPMACTDWTFTYKVCCRNCTITTIQNPCATGSEIYVETKLNNFTAPCNSSPIFGSDPVAIIPIGQLFNFNQYVTDPDGDSLAYELITPKTGPNTMVSWVSPFSMNSPLQSSTPFIIDQITGDIKFTPSQLQIGVLALQVSEYRNGIKIGSTIRDIQVYTYYSGNANPGSTGFNGSNDYTHTVCPLQQNCFTIRTTDIDSGQQLSVTVNHNLPGAVVQVTQALHPEVRFCWTPDSTVNPEQTYLISILVKDDACPVRGIQRISYQVRISRTKVTSQVTDNTCAGDSTGVGIILIDPPGNYVIQWVNHPNLSGTTLNGLSAGTYPLTVTDQSGCVLADSLTITEWQLPAIAGTIANPVCKGDCDGAIDLQISGNAVPFQVQWNDGLSGNTRTGLCEGMYDVTVQDNNGCKSNATYNLSALSSINIQKTVSQPACGDSTGGAIAIVVSGGILPYSYNWSNGAATATIGQLSPGIYMVTVSDSLGCVGYETTPIIASGILPQLQFNITDVHCKGGTNGSVQTLLSGVPGNFQYLWSNGQTTASLTGIGTGIYTLTITDSLGCSTERSFSINEPIEDLGANINVVHPINCHGDTTGVLSVIPIGGTPNYQFLWSNNATSQTIQNLNAGVYALTIRDGVGCEVEKTFLMTEPASPLSIQSNVTHFDCLHKQEGSIHNVLQGGTPKYSVHWSNGDTTLSLKNLSPGSYEMLVTDQAGCTVTRNVKIDDVSTAVILGDSLQQICIGDWVRLVADSLLSDVTYQWYYNGNLLSGANTFDFSTPAAGTYHVTITSGCGTYQSSQVTILTRSVSNAVVSPARIICPPETAQIFAKGGSKYQWQPGQTLNDSLIDNPVAAPQENTVYKVAVTDDFGCTTQLVVPVLINCDSLFIPSGFSPNADGINDGFVISGIENFPDNKVWIYNRWGALVYKASGYENKFDGISNIRGAGQGGKIPSGTYFYIVDLGDGSVPKSGYLILRR